ncbi:hypothetical protein CSC18_4853 [Klebsiella aerogenes]|nr:hypothetical protein CSC18_4853 [Klebsiella aerogenes]
MNDPMNILICKGVVVNVPMHKYDNYIFQWERKEEVNK